MMTTHTTHPDPLVFSRAHEVLLTAVRVAYGVMWLGSSLWKNPPYFGLNNHQDFYAWVVKPIQYPVVTLFSQFVQTIVLPNFIFFGWIIFVTELVLGIGFITGFKTKLLSIVALAQTILIALSVLNTPHEWPWSYYLMGMVALLFFILPPSIFSLDMLFLKKLNQDHIPPKESSIV